MNMESKEIVEKSIIIDQDAAKVWEVLTNPKEIRLCIADVELDVVSDFKVGSPITFTGKWHGVKREDHGIILKFDPYKVYKYSYWTKISRLPDTFENHAYIEFRLTPSGDKTILEVTHSNLIAKTAYEHANFYWSVSLGVIKKQVEEGR